MNNSQIRYAPKTLDAFRNYKRDLEKRIAEGNLTVDEAKTLQQARRKKMFESVIGVKRIKVQCPECSAITDVVGDVSTWVCGCSPGVERSVVDYAVV